MIFWPIFDLITGRSKISGDENYGKKISGKFGLASEKFLGRNGVPRKRMDSEALSGGAKIGPNIDHLAHLQVKFQ